MLVLEKRKATDDLPRPVCRPKTLISQGCRTTHPATCPTILALPENILLDTLSFLTAPELRNTDLLCQQTRNHQTVYGLILSEHAAMLQCEKLGWLKRHPTWKQSLYCSRIWIIVDTSASMGERYWVHTLRQQQTRLEIAKRHIARILNSLQTAHDFNLTRFSKNFDSDGPVPATAENIKLAVEKVGQWHAEGSTEVYTALREAYSDPRLQAVYLLSDGDARDADELAGSVKNWSCKGVYGYLPLHTVCIYSEGSRGREFMRVLSEISSGIYLTEPARHHNNDAVYQPQSNGG